MITGKDLSFVCNALGISLMVMALLVTFAPYMESDNVNMDEVAGVERSLQRVEPKDVPDYIATVVEREKKPAMVVFYASWCGYCARLLPGLVDMMKSGELDTVKPIFVSMDSQPRVFSKYLVKTGYYKYFPPLMLQEVLYNNLAGVMKKHGSSFQGAIPYMAFYNKDAKIVAEFTGLVDKQDLLRSAALAAR
jgi:thiol-disulfide isomerase/thioredoxin